MKGIEKKLNGAEGPVPGELSPERRKDLQKTLADLAVEDIQKTAYAGPDRRARQINEQELREIEERRGEPLPDAPAVHEAFRAVMEIAKKKLAPDERKDAA